MLGKKILQTLMILEVTFSFHSKESANGNFSC